MPDPAELKYTETHEWIELKGSIIRVGITDELQEYVTDITHIDMPEPGDHLYEEGDEIGLIESLKTASELHAPVAGTITAINTALLASPETVNDDPYESGWIFEMAPSSIDDIDNLLTFDEYEPSAEELLLEEE